VRLFLAKYCNELLIHLLVCQCPGWGEGEEESEQTRERKAKIRQQIVNLGCAQNVLRGHLLPHFLRHLLNSNKKQSDGMPAQ